MFMTPKIQNFFQAFPAINNLENFQIWVIKSAENFSPYYFHSFVYFRMKSGWKWMFSGGNYLG
jgi:hypothetical protein